VGSNQQRVARILTLSGIATIVVGVVLGLVVEPLLFAVVLVGVLDLAMARAFASGRWGAGDAPPVAGEDPDYNPYARED
jgi:hypothetical protein